MDRGGDEGDWTEEAVFSLEEEVASGPHRSADCGSTVLMQAHLSYLMRPEDAQAARVARDVELCCRKLSLLESITTNEPPRPDQLSAALSARGHAVCVLRAAGGGQGVAAFRNLRHTFLMVGALRQAASQRDQYLDTLGLNQEESCAAAPGRRIIVDPHFKCQFVLASPSPRFAALLRLLPQVFVGSMEQLEHVVDWVGREMQWSFKEMEQTLPPWREQRAMMSKWLAATAVHPLGGAAGGSPLGSPRAQPCCCCHGPAAVAGMAPVRSRGGCTSGCASPSSVCLPTFFSGGSLALGGGKASPALSSTPPTPVHPGGRVSLLSRSLDAAGLSLRAQQQPVPAAPGPNWWDQPRIITVRRSA